ncbi:LacI family DNA-binding transcriptional regulator [Limnoglobus roseus]|uniref:GntR family transcriptional regulator n=1 Tax=Limnoglobus roseus TaxID=2598579 RepID=A0A5C1APS7_9BACT|nr:GntR family transcriptional regulator [Limnoglobus roseus]QEL19762.1 GntR family transcriptional regulator [Limnoglobus roseus]
MIELAPKHILISQQIEADIRQGRWGDGRLPGVRTLAQEYGTSVVTASRALQNLVNRGLIDTVERSGCFVRSAAPSDKIETTETWGVCLRLTAGPWRQGTEAVVRGGFTALARREGYLFRDDLFPDPNLPESRLTQLALEAKATGVGGLFYLPARVSEAAARLDEVLLRACAAAKFPVVLLERNLRGNRPLTHDLIGNEDLEAGRTLTRHLIEAGRQRPACVVGSPTSSHQARLAGYLLAVYEAGVTPCVIEQPIDAPLKDAYAAVVNQAMAARADAIVCYQDYTAIGVIVELLNRGRRVPADVAVTGFEDLPIGSTFSIGVTTYAFSYEQMARRAVQVMKDRIQNPTAAPVRVAVGGQLIVRESSGR